MKKVLIGMLLIAGTKASCQDKILTISSLEKWRFDTTACKGYRKAYLPVVLEAKNELTGYCYHDILAIFGEPNAMDSLKGKYRLYYFVEGGPHCFSKSNSQEILSGIKKMFIFFNEKKMVYLIGAMNP